MQIELGYMYLPALYKFQDCRVLVNACVVHDNYGVLARERLYMVEKTVNEFIEADQSK